MKTGDDCPTFFIKEKVLDSRLRGNDTDVFLNFFDKDDNLCYH